MNTALQQSELQNSSHPILLLHGLTSCSENFSELKKHLESKGHLCFSPQLPGHRRTLPSSDDINSHNWHYEIDKHIEYLSLNYTRKVIILGQSLGALLAISAAYRHPTTVSKLILCSPPIFFNSTFVDLGLKLLSFVPSFVTKHLGTIHKSSVRSYKGELKNSYQDVYYINTLRHLEIFRKRALKESSEIITETHLFQSIEDYHVHPKSSAILAAKIPNAHLHLKHWGKVHTIANLPDLFPSILKSISTSCLEN